MAGNCRVKTVIERIYLHDKEQVLALVKNHYSGKTNSHLMFKSDFKEGAKLDRVRAINYLSYDLSVGVFEKKSGQLIGISLNVTDELDKPFRDDLQIEDPNLQAKYRFVHYLQSDVLQLLNAKKVMFGCMGTVHKDFSNQGVLESLFKPCLKMAEQCSGEHLVVTLATDYYPKFLNIVKEVKFEDYVDPKTGLRPLKGRVKEPHTHARIVSYPVAKN